MKQLFTSILILLSVITFAQKEESTGKLYKTYEDYKAGKAVEGYSFKSLDWYYAIPKENMWVRKNGKRKKVKVSDLPGVILTFKEGGVPMRIFKGHVYYILAEGKMCYYLMRMSGYIDYDDAYYYISDEGLHKNHSSNSITGEIDKLKKKELNTLFEEARLYDKYKAELKKTHRSMKEAVIAKYIGLLNEK